MAIDAAEVDSRIRFLESELRYVRQAQRRLEGYTTKFCDGPGGDDVELAWRCTEDVEARIMRAIHELKESVGLWDQVQARKKERGA
jgi:hypothetical protein